MEEMNTDVQPIPRQNFEIKSAEIRRRYCDAKRSDPDRFKRRIDYSWSVWMFGIEPVADSLSRLRRNGLEFVELKGDHATPQTGTSVQDLRDALAETGIRVSGTCGMFSVENDLSSNSAYVRQHAIDYIKRELEVLHLLGGYYLIVVPGAVGRPQSIDAVEWERSSTTLRACADRFLESGIRAAVEPIRSAEVSLVHSISEAMKYIERVDHPAIGHVNGDTYHMLLEEPHVGEAILEAGDRLANLHLADSNRNAPGRGMIDFDTVLMAAYLSGMNQEGRFLTPEPLGPITDPYLLANEPCRTEIMDELVRDTMAYLRQREDYIRSMPC